jgi:thiol:disulfide interchange protein DsbC
LTVKNRLPRAAALCAMLLCASVTLANEAQIRRSLEGKLGSNTIEAVAPGPMPGIWEVVVRTRNGTEVLYSDASGSYLLQGNIYDVRAGRDLTEERMRKLTAIKFESLPLEQAVKVRRGDGRRTLVMFSDPYCPYCQKFEQILQQVDDITVYVFMYPVIRPQAADHSKAVWCSADRAQAWLDLALDHKRPAAPASCDNPVEKNIDLGRRLRINSTPTLILANGEKVSGAMSAKALTDVLDKVLVETRKKP